MVLHLKTLKQFKHIKKSKVQQGFALASVLIMLLVITAIGATSIKIGLFDQDSVQLQSDKHTSRYRAELALTDAIDRILCTSNRSNQIMALPSGILLDAKSDFFAIVENKCTQGFCGNFTNATAWANLNTSNDTNWFEPYGRSTLNNAITQTQGRYIIEALQTNVYTGSSSKSNTFQYRITAVGFGDFNANSFTQLQIVYRPKNQTCRYNATASNVFN
jgi:Tfp pilus assembly protein PilX